MPEVKTNTDGEEFQLTGKTQSTASSAAVRRMFFGRREIFTNEREITAANVQKVLQDALPTHQANREEILYLHKYLRGDQPILYRVKDVRPEICNRIVLNLANQIVTFKTANFIGEPLQYVSRGADESVPPKIEQLNSFMLTEGKPTKDMDLAYWMFTCGVGYRLILRDKAEAYMAGELDDEAPFEIYTLDPACTFVIRANDVTRRVLAGVNYVFTGESEVKYTVYTANQTFFITGSMLGVGEITDIVTHNFGMVPIIEYPCNALRMGAFEPVISMLDAINTAESNRLDGIEQFVQALMVFENADISDEQFTVLRQQGAIKITSRDGLTSRVYYLNEQLDQSQTQTLMDDMWQTVLEIVGMPSQGDANTGDSSNNGAVYMKNGLYSTNARVAETEAQWKAAETEMLKIVFKICRDSNAFDLKISQVEQKFPLRGYEDMLTKTQSYTTLKGAGVPTLQAATITSLVTDPESFAMACDKAEEDAEHKLNEQLEAELKAATTAHTDTADDDNAEAEDE